MSDLDRRLFLKRAAIGLAGAVGASVAHLPKAGAAPAKGGADDDLSDVSAASEQVVAVVRRGDRNSVTLLQGERETVHRDPRLARLLLRASK